MELAIATIDRASVFMITDEPAQSQIVAARIDALNATSGPDFRFMIVDSGGTQRDVIFSPGEARTQNIPAGARGQFVLGTRNRADGTPTQVMLLPEYLFVRLAV